MRPGILLLLLAAGCSTSAPVAKSFNECVIEVVREYPVDGTFGYYWPKDSAWEGTTQDLVYDGVKLATGDPQRRSYCCGLTYEVFFKAYERWCAVQRRPFRVASMSASDLHELRLRWFGDSKTGERRKLVQAGIESMGLGRVVKPDEARPGDFVQFWRHGGSGHSAIFMEWVRENGAIVGLKYWSSQGSTRGIGYKTEMIGEREGVKRDEIYLARVEPR